MILNQLFLTATFDPTQPMEIAEALPYGLKTTLLGMGVVFAVLIILWAVLAMFKVVFYKAPESEKKAEAVKTEAPAPTPVAEPAPVAYTDDAELVAVITAAIASMLDAPETSFRVVSFRRTAKK